MQYISNTQADKDAILKAIGISRFEELLAKIPVGLRKVELKIPEGLSELELVRELEETGRQNQNLHKYACYLGGGVYDHFVPHVVNHLALRGEFITSYTPYQGEASQGTLQGVYEYQSLMCELTGMDYSNASMYDGASALAEAVLLAIRTGKGKKILLAGSVHPEYQAVVKTYLSFIDSEIEVLPLEDYALSTSQLEKSLSSDVAAVVVQQPNFFGKLEDMRRIGELAHQNNALFIACVNPVSLGVLESPGEYGADIAVGEGQPLGNNLSYGGPHFGFFTVKAEFLRKMPGRICGMTVDAEGKRAFVLTLQAREQHIRREKATSNICTNHALCALKATIYLSLLGPQGLQKLANLNLQNAQAAYDALLKVKGVEPLFKGHFFNEFALRIHKNKESLKISLEKHKIAGPLDLEQFSPEHKDVYLVAVTEKRTADDLKRLVRAIEEASS